MIEILGFPVAAVHLWERGLPQRPYKFSSNFKAKLPIAVIIR